MQLLLPQKTATLTELHARALDFAHRSIFKGYYSKLTEARKNRLWTDVKWFLEDAFKEMIHDWDQNKGTGEGGGAMYACDWFAERFHDEYWPHTQKWEHKVCDLGIQPKYLNMLEFICRSAIDLVDDFTGMCWGWTLGDLRRMYDDELPPWFPLDGWQYFMDGPAPPVSEWEDTAQICI